MTKKRKKATEGYRTTISKIADNDVANHDYDHAIDLYRELELDDKVQSTHIAWAESLAANNQFDEAAEQYTLAGSDDKVRELMIAKANKMIEDGNVDGILDTLRPYKGKDIADLLFRAQKLGIEDVGSEEAVEKARMYGEAITDTEMQQAWDLESCTAYILLDEGYLPLVILLRQMP